MNFEVPTKNVEDLRSHFLRELDEKGGPSIIHVNDLERVKSNDDWLKRFLLHYDLSEKEALAMLWESVQWRRDFKTNEINESNVSMDFLKDGILFSHGKDKDGYTLFIFKCKKHIKGARDFEDVKRCVIYWLERLEREEKGKPVSLFFDMEGCGVSTVDMELIKFVIHVFKQYYPYMLNYIIILEMAWILNALFKVIKTMLPEKAVQKIKFVKKSDLSQYVEPDQALKCWGGNDNYTFVFVPEVEELESPINSNSITISNKKVHFADGSPMSENHSFGDKESSGDGGILRVHPSTVITFNKEGNELVSQLDLFNTDEEVTISYKMKTTSPEKFRVRPSAGCLAPGESAPVSVTVLPGFQLGGLSRDKFLVMSMIVESADLSNQELTEMWKNPPSKNVFQHRLRCAQAGDFSNNGVIPSGGSTNDNEPNQFGQLSNRMNQFGDCQSQLHAGLKHVQLLQYIQMALVLLLSILVIWQFRDNRHESNSAQFCYKNDDLQTTKP